MDKMGDELQLFENCQKLSLSTNAIERMTALPKLRSLKILSLGRNNIKRISGLDEVGQTLEELWLSYNLIEKLDGLQPCVKLHTFFASNNKVKQWDEISKLGQLPEIKFVLFIGNPIYKDQMEEVRGADNIPYNLILILKRLPQIEFIDGRQINAQIKNLAENDD